MSSGDLKQIDISELKPGMFVVKVVSSSAAMKVKTEGFVRTETTVQNLINSGVKKIWIDPERCEHQETAQIEETQPEVKPDPYKHISFEKQMGEALALYNQAKSIQKRMMTKIQQGKGIDIKEVDLLSQNLIESVFSNHNALLFMCKMKDKDEYLYQHSLDMAILMAVFSKYLDFSPEVSQKLAMGALLIDAGMLNLPPNLLMSNDTFSKEEFIQIKPHVAYSLEIAASMPGISHESLDVIKLHHERIDGSGYPAGLQGDEINLYGRMAALIDSYTALTSDRPHKNAVSAATAFRIMKNGTPGAYDHDLMAQLIRCVGVFPVGTLVKLKSQRLALVTESNYDSPLQPKVGVFYSIRSGTHTEVKHLDLASKKVDDEIMSSVRPDEFNLDLVKFLKTALI